MLRSASVSALLAAAALAAPGLASAQTCDSNHSTATTSDDCAPAAGQPTNVEELVVVGSHIRRDNFNTPSPIEVVTRDEAVLAGMASTTEILQSNTVTAGGAQINNAFGGFVTNGGPGANTLGLRGLGATRTLILLNGRRLAPAGTRGAVGAADLNVLPDAIVDRIDILKDGASSIYGSDAVAGVVNIITRQHINGVTIEGEANVPEHSGGQQYRISAVGGFTGDRFQLSGSAEYYERTNLTLGDRSWSRCQLDNFRNAVGDPLGSGDFIDPRTGQPKCFPITFGGDNGVTINTIGTNTRSGIGAPGTLFPGTTGNFNRWRPNPLVTTGTVPGYEGVGGSGAGGSLGPRDTFEPRILNESLISPTVNYNVFLQGSFDLDALGNAELYGEVLGSRRESSQVGYRQLSLDYAVGSPLIPAFLANSVVSGPTLITNGANLGVRAFIGQGNDNSHQEVDYWKPTVGIRGDFFLPHWRYNAYYSHAVNHANYTFDVGLTNRLAQSLDVVAAPAGLSATVVRPDAAGNQVTCRINITVPGTGCIPAPALTAAVVGGNLPADWVGYWWGPRTGTTRYYEDVVVGSIDGPLFHMPYGNVQGAFGLEYRRARIDDTPPIDSQTSNFYNFTASNVTRGSDSVWEAYGEVEVPLLANVPLARSLTVNISGRYTDYRSYGADSTYKVGGVWAPASFLTFRASYGTSYRAPALFEQFQGATTGFFAANADPCNGYGGLPHNSNTFINCDSEIHNTNFTAVNAVEVITAGGAANHLSAETSTNFTAGFILQPHLPSAFGDISLAIDYYRIEVDNGVQQVGSANILASCYGQLGFRGAGGLCNLVDPRNLAGPLIVHDDFTNIATSRVVGLDYNVRYTRDIGPGRLRLDMLITQYLNQQARTFPDDPFTEFNGLLTSPAYTGALDATYTMHEWRFHYGLQWVARMNSNEFEFGPNTSEADALPFDFITPNYYLHAISIQYRSTHNWTATVGVNNLTDETPPFISSGDGVNFPRAGNALLYSGFDYQGREYFVNLSRTF
jgi:iron complex outermembrane receptor protein